MVYFERKGYLSKLISAEGNGMIKIITGIRRCGKSFLLFNIFLKLIILGDRYHSGIMKRVF